MTYLPRQTLHRLPSDVRRTPDYHGADAVQTSPRKSTYAQSDYRPIASALRQLLATEGVAARASSAGALQQMADGRSRVSSIRHLSRKTPAEQPVPRVAQRIIDIDASVEDTDRGIIGTVLAANPILDAVWRWIDAHQRYRLTVQRGAGFNRVSASLGEINITLTISPLHNDQRDDARWISTVSHELTLHLLPWARVYMYHELAGDLAYAETNDPHQLTRMRTVLGPVAGSAHELVTNINADKANKNTTTYGGNHSDIGLWTRHLQDMIAVAAAQPVDATKGTILYHTLEKMRMPMLLTGDVRNAVDRGPGAYADFLHAMTQIEGQRDKVPANLQQAFDAAADDVRTKMARYDKYLRIKRYAIATFPDEPVDETLLYHAYSKSDSVAEGIFLYDDIKCSMM